MTPIGYRRLQLACRYRRARLSCIEQDKLLCFTFPGEASETFKQDCTEPVPMHVQTEVIKVPMPAAAGAPLQTHTIVEEIQPSSLGECKLA